MAQKDAVRETIQSPSAVGSGDATEQRYQESTVLLLLTNGRGNLSQRPALGSHKRTCRPDRRTTPSKYQA